MQKPDPITYGGIARYVCIVSIRTLIATGPA